MKHRSPLQKVLFYLTVLSFALCIIFTVLRVSHVIHWSWLLVTLPVWAPFTVVSVIVALAMVLSANRNNMSA